MKKQHFSHRDCAITSWVDDFDVYRWDIALTRSVLTEMPKEDYAIILGAFHDIGEVLTRVERTHNASKE